MKVYTEALKIVFQTDDLPDCGIACLATLLGVSYHRALAGVLAVNKNVLRTGVSTANMIRAARRVKAGPDDPGHELAALNPSEYDIEEATGILEVIGDNHFVVLARGTILDLRGPSLWTEPDVFFDHYRARPGRLIVEA